MKILLLTHYYAPEQGAPQRRWGAFVRRFVAAGHDVHVICPPPHYPCGRVPTRYRRRYRPFTTSPGEFGETVHRVPYLWHGLDIFTRTADHLIATAGTLAVTRRAFRGARPDIIIATAPALPTIIGGRLVSRRSRTPLVIEMRDAWPDLVTFTPGLSGSGGATAVVKHWVHELITRWQLESQEVVTTTSAFADLLAARGARDVHVIRNGSDPELYPVPLPPNPPHEELRIVYLGTLGRSQGLATVIDAAQRVRAAGVRIRVRLIGEGADAERLRRYARQLDAPVEVRSSVPRCEVDQHYAWADTVLVTLRNWQPFEMTVPSKLYEIMMTGRHMTAVVAGEAASIICSADAGTVVAPGDAQALADFWIAAAAERSLLDVSCHAREWVEQNAAHDQLAVTYANLLEEVVRRARVAA